MKLNLKANRVLFFLGLSLPLLALLTIGWLVNKTSGQFRDSFYQVAQTYKVLNTVEQTQLHLLDAETERRGYLLAGGKEYFNAYGKAMESIQKDIQQLQSLVGHRVGQQTNITELESLVAGRLGIDLEKSGSVTNLPDLVALSLTTQGKATMDQINRVLFQMREEEESSLNLRQQHAESDAISSQIQMVVLIAAVAVALMFIVFIVLRLEKLQQVVTICAWTGQVKYDGQWIRLEEYLKNRFGLSVSHGLSKDAADKIAKELETAGRGDGPQPPKV